MAASSPGPELDLILEVKTRWQDGDRFFEYRLASPSGAVQLDDQPHRSLPLGAPEVFRRLLLDELAQLRTGKSVDRECLDPDRVYENLVDIGQWLYRRLFPASLREAYQGFRDKVDSLLVVTDEAWIPWEIVKPCEAEDDDFLCMKFAMGRWLAEAGPPVVFKGVRKLVCFLPAEADRVKLRELEAEWRILETLGTESGVEPRLCPRATASSLTQSLEEGLDLLHFAGHGEKDPFSDEIERPELARILLADGPFLARQLEGEVARRVRQDRPIVFFNSCESARLGASLTGLGGWAESWTVNCLASAFLAPVLAVEDARARDLAAIFYREIEAGRTVGQALRTARFAIRGEPPRPDAAWLAYSLYSHPNLRLALGQNVLVTERIVVDSPLSLPRASWRRGVSPPGALLRADYEVVPFHYRQTELDDLEAWCLDGKNLGIRLYTGAGGMGKTRLALEICRRLRRAGWQAGLVDHERPAAETWRRLLEIGGPRLLVVDYAETRRPLLEELLRLLFQHSSQEPVRLLLLARAQLEWWDRLKAHHKGVGELLSGPATSTYSLRALANTKDHREASYLLAAKAFAQYLEQEAPEQPPEDLDTEEYKRVLLLHIRALAAISGVQVQGERGLLDYLLDRERRFWQEQAEIRRLPPEMATGIGRAMAAITLGGGAEHERDAIQSMRDLAYFKDEKESMLTAVALLLREVYPGDQRWIGPVLPDLLGEHLVMRELGNESSPPGELLGTVFGPEDPDED